MSGDYSYPQLQGSLSRTLSSSSTLQPKFTRYNTMDQLANNLVDTMQQQRQKGITNAPGGAVIGYDLSSLTRSSDGSQLSYGFTLLFDDDEAIRAPIALNAMNIAAQSLTGNDSTVASSSSDQLQIQTSINTFPTLKEERVVVSAYIVPTFVIYGFSYFTAFYATTVVREREQGHRAHLSSMGIGSRVYLLASFIRDFVLSLIPIVASIVLLAATQLPVFAEGSALPWIFVELLLAIPMIGQAYLISNLFQRSTSVGATIGIGMAVIVFVPYFIVHFVFQDAISLMTICIVAIFLPTFGADRALSSIAIDTSILRPYSSADTFNINRTVFPVLLSLIGSAIFYWVLEVRIDARIQSGQSGSFIASYLKKRLSSKSKPAKSTSKLADNEQTDEEALEEMHRLQQGGKPTDGKEDAVRLLGLCKEFPTRTGPKTVLDGIWMATRTCECFGYLGPNGAGKTTTLKILTGQLAATNGTANICGLPIQPYDTRIHSLLGVCPQHDILWEKLTAREHLRYFARIKGVASNEIEGAVEEMIQMLDLVPVADRSAERYSGGNKRRLSLAMACIGHPRVVFLDEPTTGVDVGVRRKIWDCIRRLKERASVVLTTHSMEEADALCDRIAVMVNGKVQAIGTPQRLKNVYGAGYKILVKTTHPQGAATIQHELYTQLGAKPVQLLGCHLEMECERSNAQATTAADAAGMLARIFHLLEGSRASCGIVDYSVGQTTLGQVFVSFAERQTTV
ncbi:hypothetical protein BDF19DRAFT_455026 [Syncephalis fuscata]|nr:hypothetical protein BDF19DRAFT_455026 [Syncephalis fuscata]